MALLGGAGLAGAATAWAGLSLDEALARHRLLGDGAALRGAALTPLTLETDVADGATFAIGGPGNQVPPLLRPEARGDGGIQYRAHKSFADGDVQVRLGAAVWRGDDHPYTFDESSVSVRLGSGRLYGSIERRHWGPSWTNSLILDAGARPVPAVGWRKTEFSPFETKWLSWLGPWSADFFAGETAEHDGPQRPKLLGGRLEIMPLTGLEIGFSRVIQWGGSGRPGSLRSFGDALFGHDNYPANDPQEPGNQLAGFDLRYTLSLGRAHSVAVYAQAIGEDEAGGLPDHYLASAGADAAFVVGRASVRAFAEYADTTAGGAFGPQHFGVAYRHHIYLDGYTQLGDPLGHPAGGDVQLGSLGMLVDAGAWTGIVQLHRGHSFPTSQLYAKSGHLSGADAEVAWRVDPRSRVGLSVFNWRDPQGTRTRGQLWWQLSFP